ncbi:energy transducer TonB [Taibaiella chishuiensis]|uniref:TonB family protein n=1 Tax=Taibaiella chishuiensis TaxID=1434707 RepID=A0A2P8D9I0_9BACT|nr:energy transducer TonB [Taibaiella chishuiensis]PSK93862.1 TonB family protein [Taibaiella chishuiensis]
MRIVICMVSMLLLAGVQARAQPGKKQSGNVRTAAAAARFIPPQFPGGPKALATFLDRRIRYPSLARETELQGTVLLSFFINEQGLPEDIRITRDIGGGCGAEAVRVVKQMPPWIPGTYAGKKVRAWYELPVSFTLR